MQGMGSLEVKSLLDSRLVWHPPRADRRPAARWSLDQLGGRIVELSGQGATAVLSVALGLVLEAQRTQQPVAWIACGPSFHPPDAAAGGVDLAALPVVRVTQPRQGLRAAELLLRSAALGLVVLDLALAGHPPELPLAAQTRLAGLAQRHDSALVCLTRRPAGGVSLGSLVSLHAEVERRRLGRGRYLCRLQVVKDKQRGPGWGHQEQLGGPPGLR
jgi:recombination protein RecA